VSVTVAVIAGLAIFVGATVQRLAGTGVGLVAAPVMAILIGPVAGILVMNATGMLATVMIVAQVWRDVDWRRFVRLVPGMVVGVACGAAVAVTAPESWLEILIGALVLAALATTFGLRRVPHVTSPVLAPATGVAAGFVSMMASVTGSVMVIYAKLYRLNQRGFVGTMQPIGFTAGALSVAAKILVGAAPASSLPPWWIVPVIVVALVGGVLIGGRLSHRVSSLAARNVAVTLAGLGALAAMVRGFLAV
jgi:uncharacterized membrane protein YfcA